MDIGLNKAISYLIGFVVILGIYFVSRSLSRGAKNIPITLVKGIVAAALIAAFANSTLGSHSENCDDDPIYGRCDSVQDYEPTTEQYTNNFFFWFLLSIAPIGFGIYKGSKETDKFDSDEDINNVVMLYGRVMESVSKETLTKYPAFKYPLSLLPSRKERIQAALEQKIKGVEQYQKFLNEMKSTTEDEKESTKNQLESLRVGLYMLKDFVSDSEAKKVNLKLINDTDYQQGLKRSVDNKTK